eukprot:GDKJ01025896.1.p1 GENE.GDKJ01025896.1~~GDKJ01025896.1.p1  ORF type:complete len:112 (+),score=12.61 GDKJ01025896.1:45-380(+)
MDPVDESFTALKEKAYEKIKKVVEKTLDNATYSPKDVQNWVDAINQGILTEMQNLSSNFKFIASTNIIQRSNAGFHASCACLWDHSTDSAVSYRFENKTMHCIATVYGIGV